MFKSIKKVFGALRPKITTDEVPDLANRLFLAMPVNIKLRFQ